MAVDNRFYGLIPAKELFEDIHRGDVVEARVVKVREDGKLDLSPREKAYLQMDTDSQIVLKRIEELGGALSFNDKASPRNYQERVPF